jgi:DNA modification methylase
MLAHFLEMVVDPTTRILDPTCGSGTALRVAKNLGAALGLGFDVQEQHVDYVNKQLEKENAES